MTRPFVYTMRVRFRDTDMQGHVYFGNYFVFCDEALGAYMRAVGVPWQDMVKSGTDMFYVNATCDYLGSARFEEDVHIETRIADRVRELHQLVRDPQRRRRDACESDCHQRLRRSKEPGEGHRAGRLA